MALLALALGCLVLAVERVHVNVERGSFADSHGREVYFHGVNYVRKVGVRPALSACVCRISA